MLLSTPSNGARLHWGPLQDREVPIVSCRGATLKGSGKGLKGWSYGRDGIPCGCTRQILPQRRAQVEHSPSPSYTGGFQLSAGFDLVSCHQPSVMLKARRIPLLPSSAGAQNVRAPRISFKELCLVFKLNNLGLFQEQGGLIRQSLPFHGLWRAALGWGQQSSSDLSAALISES